MNSANLILDDEIEEVLRMELGKEFVGSFVVGLRLSDRYKDTIEVDFVIFLKRETEDNDGWNKQYTALNVIIFFRHESRPNINLAWC